MFSTVLIVIGMITVSELILFVSYLEDNTVNIKESNILNPIHNYKRWKMNWFGVIFFTALINIVFPIYSICYWFYKLCTVGRK